MAPNPSSEFMAAYDAYADAIFRRCYFKTSNREQAKDLTQQVFLQAWTYVRQGKKVENWQAFLYRIAHNLIIDWYRRKRADSLEVLKEEQGFEPIAKNTDPVTTAAALEALRTLSQLSEEEQALVTWRYVDDLSPQEIAEILGEKENTVSVKLHRALKKLREFLS